MAGVSAHGGTFTFSASGGTLVATVTRVSVESPKAEIVNMTDTSVTSASALILVPTGAWAGDDAGRVRVDYIHGGGLVTSVTTYTRHTGRLTFASSGFSVVVPAICESVTAEAGVGEIVRGTMNFALTYSTHTITIT